MSKLDRKREYNKQYYEANKEEAKQYRDNNKEHYKEYNKKYRKSNKEKKKEYNKQYREANKEDIKQYRESNKEYYKEYNKQYREATKEKRKEDMRKYQKQRRKVDSLFKISGNLRNRTKVAFKRKGYKKTSKTQEMLGVDWEVCKAHIERQFKIGMNWSNYGEWHIDHIIPLASANNEKDLMKLCYYRNLQPLWAEDNLMKSAKILGQQSFMKL